MFALRDFQDTLIEGARTQLRSGVRRLLIQLATGGGKTVIAAFIIAGAQSRDLRVWFVVHRKELLKQTSATFTQVGIPHGFIAADFPTNGFLPVQLCGVQTLALRLDTVQPPDVIIWDEAHHATAGTWATVMSRFPDCIHIGLTATPQRLDGAALGDHFDAMIMGPSTAALIKRGFLSPYTYFAPGIPDLVGVRSSGSDFNRGDLSALLDEPKLIGDVVDMYLDKAPGEQGIVFAVNREHSRHLAEMFRARGIPAAHVDGTMSTKERDRFDAAFRAGDVRVGCNVDLFGEGYDVPNIGYVGLARSTMSLTLHRQQCGRGLRIADGKERTIICDHAGNALRGLGLPDDEVIWSLEGKSKGGRNGSLDATPIHQCPICFQVTPSSLYVCPCGYQYKVQERSVAWAAGELFELQRLGRSDAEMEKQRISTREKDEERGASLSTLIRLATERNRDQPGRYKDPKKWALMRISLREQWKKKGARRAHR